MRALVSRAVALIPVTLGVGIITFFAIRLVPGDVVDALLGENYDAEVAERLRAMFGLDRSLPEQFGMWLSGILHGDLGTSLRTGRPVSDEIAGHFPQTLELAVSALVISLLIAIPVGVVSATRRNSKADIGLRLAALAGLSIPNFFLGILLILTFAVWLRLLPSGGYLSPSSSLTDHLKYLALPALTLGAHMAAVTMRMTRSSLLEVLGQDFLRTARGKGLPEQRVVVGHALRNALIPVVTVVGVQVGYLLGGAVVVEQVFSWPGMGTMIVGAVFRRDYPLLQGGVMALALFFVLTSFIVDVLYIYLDPRLRHG